MICLFAYILHRYYAQSVPAVEESRQIYAGIGRYMDLLRYPGSGPAIVFSFGNPFMVLAPSRSYHTVFLSLFFRLASGRKIVILPIKQTNCTINTPARTPMLSMATSRLEGPRPATIGGIHPAPRTRRRNRRPGSAATAPGPRTHKAEKKRRQPTENIQSYEPVYGPGGGSSLCNSLSADQTS